MPAVLRRAFAVSSVAALATAGLLTTAGPASAGVIDGRLPSSCSSIIINTAANNPYNPIPTASYTPPAGASVNATGTVAYARYDVALAAWIVAYCDV